MNLPTSRGGWRHTRHALVTFSLMTLAVATTVPVLATQARPLNLEELSARAGMIFSGRCTGVENRWDDRLRTNVSTVTFQVERWIKGRRAGPAIIRTVGEAANSNASHDGPVPEFQPGEEVILFLYKESLSGMTSPVGLGQGKFVVFADKNGRRLAMNGQGNSFLFRGLSPNAERKLETARHGWRGGGEVEAEALLGMAEALVR